MPTINPTGDEFLVNTTTQGDQRYQAITTLADGTLLVTWLVPYSDGSGYGLLGQRYDASGTEIGSEFPVVVATPYNSIDNVLHITGYYEIRALEGGGYVVAWSESSAYISIEVFDSSGEVISSGLHSSVGGYDDYYPSLAPLPDGGFALVWSTNDNDQEVYDIHLQRFAANGNMVGDVIRVNTATPGTGVSLNNARVAGLEGGGFAVTWQSPGTYDLLCKVYDATGTPVGDEFVIADDGSNPAMLALGGGNFVVAWAGSSGMVAQLFDSSGNAIGEEIRVNDASLWGMYPSIAELTDGRFVISWMMSNGGPAGDDVYARAFNANGTPASDIILLNQTTDGQQTNEWFNFGISALPDGGFAATWQSEDQDGEWGGVYARLFAVTTGPNLIEGDDEPNALVGTAYDDSIFGFGGDDILEGAAGDDRLDGGFGADTASYASALAGVTVRLAVSTPQNTGAAGTDTLASVENLTGSAFADVLTGKGGVNVLEGLAGNDRLNGGSGRDTLIGGQGSDTYYVDTEADVITELSGEGADRVVATSSYTLSANVENLTLTRTAISGTGNDLANLLTGNSAANTLSGGGGNDTLNGGAGADTLIGGIGNDTYGVDDVLDVVTEAVAEGIDTVKSSVSFTLDANVERLTLTGSAAVSGTGNSIANTITGNGAANELRGERGLDTLSGGAGADHLYGGLANDRLTGGAGADNFYFDTALNARFNLDKILDFSTTDDCIYLDLSVFTEVAAEGALSAEAFQLGTAAVDADDRIIYDSATGKIYYDADGNGSGVAVPFAQVTAGTALTSADIFAY